MENNLKVPAKLHVPKRTAIAIKKTSLLIDELELRREKEAEFKLTPAEVDQYLQLKEVFKTQRPAEKIESAIEDDKKLKEARILNGFKNTKGQGRKKRKYRKGQSWHAATCRRDSCCPCRDYSS